MNLRNSDVILYFSYDNYIKKGNKGNKTTKETKIPSETKWYEP